MKNLIYTGLIIGLLSGCIEPFDPPEISDPERILVVEGSLDAPEGRARVVLSEIRNLSSPSSDSLGARIRDAVVSVVADGVSFRLTETSPGLYEAILPVQAGTKAVLNVEALGEIYESDEVEIRPVPEIDSITWSADDNGVTIEVTTGDPAGQTRYYQWTYVETAKYRTQFGSDFYYDGSTVIQRMNEQFLNCWKSIPSSSIVIATTDGLAEDVVFKYPVARIPADSWKKEMGYSMLLQQYSISEETFIFLRELENNTENVGSLFDPQPGRIFGNVRCVSNPDEYVLGLFSGRTRTSERFFLDIRELPDYPSVLPVCPITSFDTLSVAEVYNLTEPRTLMGVITTPAGTIIGYTYAFREECMDCRLLRDGTNIEPDFWE